MLLKGHAEELHSLVRLSENVNDLVVGLGKLFSLFIQNLHQLLGAPVFDLCHWERVAFEEETAAAFVGVCLTIIIIFIFFVIIVVNPIIAILAFMTRISLHIFPHSVFETFAHTLDTKPGLSRLDLVLLTLNGQLIENGGLDLSLLHQIYFRRILRLQLGLQHGDHLEELLL